MAKGVDLSVIAKTTPYFSGADLENIVNEAAIIAATKGKDCIDLADLEEARDKTKWGKQKKSKIMDEEDKKITAYHESGHALVVEMVKECDPIHKITIIPRGVSLGSTMTMPEKDRYHLKKSYCLAIITMLYGGRAAEELFFDDLSAGARDDIKRATELARSMVCEWGMSEKLGPICYTEAEEHLFLGREITRTARHSDDIALEIDKEIHKIIDSCYKRAKKIVTENKDKLERLAQTLLKHETLSAEEVKKVLQGIEITASPNK
jgi:cell division protease FtsH